MFKVFGAYALTEDLTLSANLSIYSGRPRNAFGVSHPNVGEYGGQVDYGQTYYVCSANCSPIVDGNLNLDADGDQQFPIIYDDGSQAVPQYQFNPRGSAGTTDWVTRLDLSLAYNMEIGGSDITLRADVFNVLEGDSVTYYNEDVEENIGELDGTYGIADSWQTPRYVQFSASFKF